MPQDIKNEVDKLVKEINKTPHIKKIYLFGSFAYGSPNENSDIDLCVLTSDTSMRKRDLVKSIRKSIVKVATMPVDILVYYVDEFFQRAVLESTIEYKIAGEGVSIYEQ